MTIKLSEIEIHPVFPISPYSMAFKNKTDADDFNKALTILKSSKKYQKLQQKYDF